MSQKNNTTDIQINKKEKNKNDKLTIDDIFSFIDLYFKNTYIIYQHQYNSFDKFIDDYIKNFLLYGNHEFFQQTIGNQQYKYRFKFENIKVELPRDDKTKEILYPMDARDRGINYSSKIIATVSEIQDIYDFSNTSNNSTPISRVIVKDNNITVAKIPIMVKSKYCSLVRAPKAEQLMKEDKYDPGGYFIINGNEKVIVPQERATDNKPFIDEKNEDRIQCQIRSKQLGVNGTTQVLRIFYNRKNDLITIKVPILNEFPVVALFRIMGFESDKSIIDLICQNENDVKMRNILRRTIRVSSVGNNPLNTKEKCIDYLSGQIKVNYTYYSDDENERKQEKRNNLLKLLQYNFLPHMEEYHNPDTPREINYLNKIIYIAYCVNRLLQVVLQRQPYDDRDTFTAKRVDLAGDLLYILFTQSFKQMLKECQKTFKTKNNGGHSNPINILDSIKKITSLEKNINSALLTGKFNKYDGVAQALSTERLTYLSTMLKLRELNNPVKSPIATRLSKPRMYHYSQIGFICPIETSEHKNVGFLKHFSIAGTVTVPMDSQIEVIQQIVKDDIIKLNDIIDYSLLGKYTKVFINGQLLGICDHGLKLFKKLKELKLNGTLDKWDAIVLDDILNELRINCDGGRLIRPIFTVKNNKLNYTHKMAEDIKHLNSYIEFMQKYPGVVEFIDCDEQSFSLISPDQQTLKNMRHHQKEINTDTVDPVNRYNHQIYMEYSHCEIHPALLLGIIGTTVTMLNHNNNSRNILFAAQCKQALGVYSTSYRYRLDKAFLAYYSNRPLIGSRTSKIINYDIIPPGENCIIAIMAHTGYNQEDNIIINKASIERGLFNATYFDKIIDKLSKNQETGQNEEFTKPTPDKVKGLQYNNKSKYKNYDKLNNNGYVPEEVEVENNDVIIGKITPIEVKQAGQLPYIDNSTVYSQYSPAIIDKVWANTLDSDGYKQMKIRTRSEKIPQLGDKVTTRQAQKGTIGLIMAETDMPYTEQGIIPDIIFNPSSILGRMTMGYILEMLLGKASAISRTEIDATPFSEISPENAEKLLEENGFNKYGLETMYSGINGQKIECKIFIGPMYYLRLKHLASNKISARSTGANVATTRQPVEGKIKGGGAKIGEMERDCIIAHGTASYLKEKLLDNSDAYECYICDKCGMLAERIKKNDSKPFITDNDKFICTNCNNKTEISKVRIPYAFKQFIQELQTISCNLTMKV